jgi:ABC-type multidrug transport system fused ATPase/permease subunit
MLFNILSEFYKENKNKVLFYIGSCTLNYIVKILLVSRVYSDFFNKNNQINSNIKNLLIVWVLRCVMAYLKSYNESIILPEITFFIRKKLFSDYININSVFYNDVDVNMDLRQIIDLSRLIRDIFVWFSEAIIPMSILMICINGYLAYKFPSVGLVNLCGNMTSLGIIFYNYKKILESSIHKETLYNKILKNIEDKFNNLMNIYLNNNQNKTIEEVIDFEKEHINFYRKQCRELDKFSTSVKITNYFFSIICLYILHKRSNLSDFLNVLLIFTFYIQTFETFTEDIPMYTLILANIRHIEYYLDNKIYNKKDKIKNYTKSLDNYNGGIKIDNISFKYDTKVPDYSDYINKNNENNENNENNKDEDKNVIDNLSLNILPKERIAIIAKSGRGKTTLMKLILSFYKPDKGNIYLGDINVNDISPNDIRKKINYINQRTLLFNDTIINNMKYGNDKTDSEIINFLIKYKLLDIFTNCDVSPNTCLNRVVDLNGSNMSMGMQKIIFLVRGILKKDTVVYIFDEPLTSLDPSSRENVINMIKEETINKTLIIITHDDEISQIVDKTFNL